jgi:hypothetical protein
MKITDGDPKTLLFLKTSSSKAISLASEWKLLKFLISFFYYCHKFKKSRILTVNFSLNLDKNV